jgi:hypothetical protein
MIPMKNQIDCGKISVSNHLETMLGWPAEQIYAKLPKQPSWWPWCDFWDSPSRHFAMIEELTGQSAGLVPCDPLLVPSVVLLRLSWTAWHWVTVAAVGHNTFIWHDGHEMTNQTFQERFPGCKVILAYALGGVVPLPWYWRLWGRVTSWL